jgi:uncharacterized protein (DUF885 family)
VGDVMNAAEAVNALSDRFWNGFLDLSPITATLLGYEQGMDRLDDPGPAGRDKARALMTSTLAEADNIEAQAAETEGLPLEERITLDILRVICDTELEQQAQRIDRLKVVDQMDGPQTFMPLLAAFQPTETPAQFDAFLARLAQYPAFMAANAEIVREGLAGGLTAARIVTERVISQLERLLAIPDEQSPIVAVLKLPKPSDRDRLVEAVGKYVRPADRVVPGGAAGQVPRGLARRAGSLLRAERRSAVQDPDPSLDIAGRMDAAESCTRSGWMSWPPSRRSAGSSPAIWDFGDDTEGCPPPRSRATRPQFPSQSRSSWTAPAARSSARWPPHRSTSELCRGPAAKSARCEPYKEADAPAAYYYPPSADGSRPGVYYVNTYDLPSRSYVGLASTSFHEAVPGHHFQIALQSEHPSLNAFRRLGSRMAGMAYVEGWGLYSERLADEMGLYLNQAERFGMLDGQSWRAARLVVDTGIHAFHWTREKSIAQLLEAGLSRNRRGHRDGPLHLPAGPGPHLQGGPAPDRAAAPRGNFGARPAFDIRAFHDAVLGHGTLPLATLAKELPGWLGSLRSRAGSRKAVGSGLALPPRACSLAAAPPAPRARFPGPGR